MKLTIHEVTKYLESLAPKTSQEGYDNSGLIVGDIDREISKVLICLDSLESVIDEAIETGCELVIAHHPIVFKGLKSLTGKDYVERIIIKCIQNNIALYAIHTNLDNYRFGVNFEIGKRLGLKKMRVLAPKTDVLRKLVVFVPEYDATKLANALFKAGAGNIGNYSECSYAGIGVGTFNPQENSMPYSGEIGKRKNAIEERIEVLVPSHNLNAVLKAMNENHPYEEVAYDIIKLENQNQYEGSGMIGELDKEIDELKFLKKLKKDFNCGVIRHTALRGKKIKTVAFCGGSGSFLLKNAINEQADIFITGDFKYHEFFDSDNQIVIADIGHYESEQFTINLLGAILTEKFPNFAVHLTINNTNPINYL